MRTWQSRTTVTTCQPERSSEFSLDKDSSKLPGTLLKKLVLPLPVRMPLERSRFEQLPLPSLHWYAGFSGLALFYVLVYAIMSPDGPARTLESEIWCTAVSGSTDARSVKLPTPLGSWSLQNFTLSPLMAKA